MAIPVLIIGQSGSGKTTSLRNIENTFVVNVVGKPLPFKKHDIIYNIPILIALITTPWTIPFFFKFLHSINEEMKAAIAKLKNIPDSINLSSILV